MERYVSVAEVRELLETEAEARRKLYDTGNDEEESNYLLASQKASLDHAQKTCDISKEQAEKIMAEALELDYVTPAIAVKIADILPEYPEDVRAIFSKERVVLEKDQIEKILDIVLNNQ